ncbi:probable serine hydrolase [Ctenocephalides felis]|uniref:probable serine hydrolase n=1 Tax=Ctenocephalides felis TaxID=7515 RepID=UPI000E6E329D|nr:probable serine hydrolase [Ctenocephalides felis]
MSKSCTRLFHNLRNVTHAVKRSFRSEKSITKQEVKDVSIPMPWGHISGKLWNPHLETRPILAVHGWLDNCNTFNTLAPLLPKHVSLLSIDFPGHGLSSRIPDGLMYSTFELPVVLYRIQQHFGWDKISLLGHSMGSIIVFMYCCTFPEKATFKSVNKELCHHLLQRCVAPSHSDPKKFYFTGDKRLPSMIVGGINQESIISLARNINLPFLAVKATNSPYFEDKKYYYEVLDVLKKNHLFEHHYVEGTHHVHLNEPEKLKDIINGFITKYRPPV